MKLSKHMFEARTVIRILHIRLVIFVFLLFSNLFSFSNSSLISFKRLHAKKGVSECACSCFAVHAYSVFS